MRTFKLVSEEDNGSRHTVDLWVEDGLVCRHWWGTAGPGRGYTCTLQEWAGRVREKRNADGGTLIQHIPWREESKGRRKSLNYTCWFKESDWKRSVEWLKRELSLAALAK